ncbi:Dps family protein [Parvibaculum sp.]|uniref:Dps family protein n=1 Tax=Parvibaculum sp. TaxID=2024848 RepID=UPI001DAB5E66|nr:DNA starvation/stationary phase protection protein [Parvibaculum sp.]MCW5727374.1 DNA starvation/stationary phase protection protein [Parvibaculum sp.]
MYGVPNERRPIVKVDTGIAAKDRNEIAEGLSRVLADTYTLYLKTHNYHWNVTGPQFRTLHLMFEEQYRELWAATDEIAERIRALGEFAPGTYAEFGKLSTLQEDNGVPGADQMVKNLVKGHEQVVKTARDLFKVASDADDEVTADLMVQRMQVSEKTAWMLRSLAE